MSGRTQHQTHLILNDIDRNGERDIIVFSDDEFSSSVPPGFYLHYIYSYSRDLKMYVAFMPSQLADFPKVGFNIEKATPSLIKDVMGGGYSYSKGYVNYYVKTE